ncbi:MAG: hypothetical protein EOP53_05860 [Sphingobacteriales bacterium]|nr:MAG: hypothetical protein EOP53_05860 [Sphingobacteriales bacterium]
MENINQYPDAILNLLKNKDFASLTKNEKTEVEAFLDEELYAKLRETYSQIQSSERDFVNQIKVRSQTQNALLQALEGRKKATVWDGIVQYKVPFWQAAAAVLLVFSSFLLMGKNNKADSPAMATITDTIKVVKQEVEKVLVYDTVRFIEKPSKTKAKKSPAIILVKNKQRYHSNLPNNSDNLSVLSLKNRKQIQRSGYSLSDDSLVNKFNFVTIN